MFVLSSQGNAMYQAVAMLVTLALAIWMLNIQGFAQAANLTSVSNTLSDSDRSVVSNHTIRFTVPTGVGVPNGATTTIAFPVGFNLSTSTVDFTDIDVATSTGEFTLAATCAGAEDVRATISGQTLTLVFCPGDGGLLAAGDTVTVEIGTHATNQTTGDQRVTNHSVAGSYEFTISTPTDSGQTRVAILDDVLVTANVNTSFDFVVSGFLTSGFDVNGTNTNATSSATALPFGTLTANQIKTLAQRLQVTTNAINGFVVTVFQSGAFLSTTGADIDSFSNGTNLNTPGAWVAPTNNVALENTWGHWGVTSEDDLNTNEFRFCAASSTQGCWVAASTSPRQVFRHAGPADGTTTSIGSTTVGYQVQITALQEAADDYNTTLTYIATPTF